MAARQRADYDVIIIGAGVSGLYQLYRLRERGFRVRLFEAGSGVGGTWYWNRYPGARFDSESYSYGYSFSPELLREWNWSEHFAAQPETLRYLEFVADKFDLRRDITFDTRITAASFDAATDTWTVHDSAGLLAAARFLIMAVGALTVPVMPTIEGVDSFKGEAHHTARWPHHPVSFSAKRVGVIGTGATGVQVIQEVAKSAQHLTVFQRTPNWCAPLHNRPITDAEQTHIRAGYAETFAICRESFAAFRHVSDRRNALDVSAEEREAMYQKLYDSPGFGLWMANFRDVLVKPEANKTLSDFVARKIRERVRDQATAAKLIPSNHGFGTRRVPLETRYYEVYNQANVELIDIRATPIERVTADGIQTTAALHALDMIIYATGFDAVLGALSKIEIRGRDSQALAAKWSGGPRTLLGMMSAGFPNLFFLVGPHSAATFCNMPRCIEHSVEWLTALLEHLRTQGKHRVETRVEAEDAWTSHVHESAARLLLTQVDSWFMGVNRNLPGRDTRHFLLYAGGFPTYRRRCEEIALGGYAELAVA